MARSKFPGKPSKPVNRTRINVLYSTDSNSLNNLDNIEVKQGNCKRTIEIPSVSTHKSVVRTISKRKRACNTLIALKKRSSQKLISVVNDAVRSVRKKADQRSEKELPNRKLLKTRLESSNLVGKFMLPTRSVHSSRVIKPNKRFINVEAVNSVQVRTFKKRAINKKANTNSVCDVTSNNGEYKKENEDAAVSHTPCSTRRIILRQARLQLDNQTHVGPEGPFSSNHNSNISPPGTVTCGVCGAVRFYRFVKQARKFNIYSCESCRKFISKMIKRQANTKKLPIMECLKGQGTCHVPPIVRSQQWKFRCAYKARCNACWLKMCLRSFQIPQMLKKNLIGLLPEYMRDPDALFNTSLFSFHTSANASVAASKIRIEPEFHIRRRPLRKKIAKEPVILQSTSMKRQKIDLKGPRVKHVCRSASIVLGQPIAVFPEADKKVENLTKLEEPEDVLTNKENSIDNKNAIDQDTEIQKRENHARLSAHSLENKTKKLPEVDNNICVDFWENYDPEEVCQNGFGLIASLSFPMLAVCYLCGSAGQDPLLYCCLCCEPYHLFCLEQPPQNIDVSNNCYNWLCPRCTMCAACGEADKQKLNCQKCHRAYHPECFNVKWRIDDRPTVCSSCMRCKSCGINNITKFVGNTPLCLMCFRLRKKGNFCPLCQKCYEDNDFDTKMMECAKCNMWIHAKCEGLSDEQYQILSLLPESVEFLCCICEPMPYWRKAVDSELRSSFNNVLRLLSKNRVARSMLKWSPTCFTSPSSKAVTAVRKLQFSDDSDVSNVSSADENSENNTEKSNFRNMQKKYKLKELKVAIKPCIINTDNVLSAENEKITIKTPNTLSLTKVKNKLNSKEYFSINEFHETMVEIFGSTKSSELLDIYSSILSQVFPWYNPTQASTGDKLNNSFCNSFSDTSKPENTARMYDSFKHEIINNIENDDRICALCKSIGDGPSYLEARLLYCGNNEWVHANCALWSSEVYEEIDGSLQNVQSAISRGRYMRCAHCKLKGASIGCCAKSCYETYHFSCAHVVKCFFMQDKSIYCPSHGDTSNESVISSPSDFAIRRSVYVELDKKKKRYVEPKKVQFMVGSLCVTSLGIVTPLVSDKAEAIIPTSFACRRLFWSTSQPWKLIPYVITTRVLSSQNNGVIKDRNFTVDHSLPKALVEKKIKEVWSWQKELENHHSGCTDLEDDEEPQNENAADILSPELTDAILEELPHEFLDGISMQDIFPKLMSNEELIGMDFKASDMIGTDLSRTEQANAESIKKIGFFEDNKETFDAISETKKDSLQHLQNINRITKARNHQRSCSVTLSCKVDNSSAKPIKAVAQDKSLFLQLLQVDGACDSGSDSESTTPNFGVSYAPEISDEPVKCERCQCTYRTSVSYKRHLTTCEEISTSESDSEVTHEQERAEVSHDTGQSIAINAFDEVEDTKNVVLEPFVLKSYESYSSFQTAQNETEASSYVSADSSADIAVSQNNEIFFSNFQPSAETKSAAALFSSQNASINVNQPSGISISQSSNATLCDSPQVTLSINQSSLPINNHINTNPSNDISLYLTHSNCNSIVNHPSAISIVQPPLAVNQPNALINASAPLHIGQPVEVQPQQLTIQPVPIQQDVSSVLSINPKVLTTSNVVAQTVTVPHNQFVRSMFKPTIVAQKPVRTRGRPRSLAAKRTRQIGPRTLFIPQNSTGGPSVLVQQLPSTNMIPTFIETFQQQTGHNLQYIATITPQIAPTVSAHPQLVQLQPEGTLVNLVPGVQPAVILPQPRLINDQILVDNNGSLMWAPQPVQPIFYGFETIVQNTVLQSQQFLPSTVSGVLTTNSSYSSTTQVFQTSKLEPVLDVASGNIVLVNSNPVVNSQPFQVPNSIPNAAVPTAPLVITDNKSTVPWSVVESSNKNLTIARTKPPPEIIPLTTNNCTNAVSSILNTGATISNSVSTSSITLPSSPFIPESGIPTNIVTPTPKLISSIIPPPPPRPMNRVLPMPTNNLKQIKTLATEKSVPHNKSDLNENQTKNSVNKSKAKVINILDDIIIKPIPDVPIISEKIEDRSLSSTDRDETSSVKLIFQKQNDSSLYKINSNYNSKNTTSVQVAPLKPMKPKNCGISPVSNLSEKFLTEKIANTIDPCSKQNSKSDKPESAILYTVESQDGFNYSSTSISELWNKVFEAVQSARLANDMSPLPSSSLNVHNGLQVLGLKTNGLKYLIEQLPDVGKCAKYKPTFHTPVPCADLDDDENTEEHPHGSARFLPYRRTHEPTDLFGWLASKHRKPHFHNLIDFEQYTRRGSITNLPMAMQFRHLKLTSKQSVGVYRSKIHKRGLFCHRDIESGEMVIEYAGEVIRSVLADKREKHYTLKGMGCYMFRIDENFVVDATMKGNAARFINHSCDPNCYSKVVEILGYKHIIIFALRKIVCGEELTYDYKFPFEEDKIPCTCGSRRCRKFLN